MCRVQFSALVRRHPGNAGGRAAGGGAAPGPDGVVLVPRNAGSHHRNRTGRLPGHGGSLHVLAPHRAGDRGRLERL